MTGLQGRRSEREVATNGGRKEGGREGGREGGEGGRGGREGSRDIQNGIAHD